MDYSRKYLNLLQNWFVNSKQPLLLKGVRQCGKTHLLKQLGATLSEGHFHYFNFEENRTLEKYFTENLAPEAIIKQLSIHSGRNIASDHLIVFDEVQTCSEAINSLKYFAEDAKNQKVVACGSLIGVYFSDHSFPVGKLQELTLHPLDFVEFLMTDPSAKPYHAWQSVIEDPLKQNPAAHQILCESLREYLTVGGMPAVVAAYREAQQAGESASAFTNARAIQDQLVTQYCRDFAKHAGGLNALHLESVFRSVAAQLGRVIDGSVQRYRFKDAIKDRSRFAQQEGVIHWLVQAGLVNKIKTCNRAEIPLESFTQENLFRLYLFDVGILGAMLKIPPSMIYSQEFGMNKGFALENLVSQMAESQNLDLYGWQEGASEIEFLFMDQNGRIFPLEVKSRARSKAKSLASYQIKYKPVLAFKISWNQPKYVSEKALWHWPLYLIGIWPLH